MKNIDVNTEELLNEVLQKFFKKEEIIEFNSIHKSDECNPHNLSATINSLMTFSSQKLQAPGLYEFLFDLADKTAKFGERSISISIYKSLLNLVKTDKNLTEVKARAYIKLGELYSETAEWGLSLKFSRAAEKLFKTLTDYRGLAKVENLYGIIEGDHGNIVKAQKHFQASLSYLCKEDDPSLRGKLLTNLGIIENILGNFAEAIYYYEKAVSTFEINENFERAAEIKHNLGMLYLKNHDYIFAINKFDESINDSLKTKHLQHLGISYLSKAEVYIRISEFEIASTFAKKALEISTKINDRLTIADCYKVIGIIQRNKNNYESSENNLLKSMRINMELGNKLNQAETAYELGILYKDIRKNEESKKFFQEALNYYKKINALHAIPDIKNYLPN